MLRSILTAEDEIMLRNRSDSLVQGFLGSGLTLVLHTDNDVILLSDHHLWQIPPDGLLFKGALAPFISEISTEPEDRAEVIVVLC